MVRTPVGLSEAKGDEDMPGKKTDKNLLRIGEVAKVAGVPLSTVRYYTDIGLLKVASHTKGGYRLYDREEALSIIRKIKPVVDKRRTLMQIKEDLTKKIKKRK
jgi:DNA-binding transcriptional MerR regulator